MMEVNQKDIFPDVPVIAGSVEDTMKQMVNSFVRDYNKMIADESRPKGSFQVPRWVNVEALPDGPIKVITWGRDANCLLDERLLELEAFKIWEGNVRPAGIYTPTQKSITTMNQQSNQTVKFTPGFSPHQAQGSFAYFENETIQWGMDRKIIQHSSSRAQASKANEEIDELLDHTSRLHEIRQVIEALENAMLAVPQSIIDREIELLSMIEDDIGDTVVCLIMVAEIEGLDLKNCLAKAYSEIKDRRGEMRSDGKFYKESPAAST